MGLLENGTVGIVKEFKSKMFNFNENYKTRVRKCVRISLNIEECSTTKIGEIFLIAEQQQSSIRWMNVLK